VVVNAHRINAGQPPLFGEHHDFFLFPVEEPEATAEAVVDVVARRIPRRFGIHPREIQVLTPMHRGPAGAGNLNTLLQQALAPYRDGRPERRHGTRVFRLGDMVIQIRNNYHKGTAGVFNGTVGTVTALSITDQQVTVRTDEDEDIGYDFDELDELQDAYAITVHRSQGSEYPGRGRPTDYELLRAATANLLYTAITRARETGGARRQP
jgi:exodeoxyribonuclease V alpha subunit